MMNYYVGRNLLESLGFVQGIETNRIHWRFIGNNFEFSPDSNEYKEFTEFLSSKEGQDILNSHRNMARIMLCGTECGLNQELVLSLRKTDYAHTAFIWHDYYQKHKDVFAQNLINHNQFCYPNSFCLHLIIETTDHKIVQTNISSRKRNDYPNTICYTIGEQLEPCDLEEADFVGHWIRRALGEEFGIPEQELDKLVDDNSFRALGLYCEKDIFNYALLCVARTKCCFLDFYNTVINTIDKDEIETVECVDRDDIPYILNKIERGACYHPSTWMRLIIYNSYME